jgi:hypothetical protein
VEYAVKFGVLITQQFLLKITIPSLYQVDNKSGILIPTPSLPSPPLICNNSWLESFEKLIDSKERSDLNSLIFMTVGFLGST